MGKIIINSLHPQRVLLLFLSTLFSYAIFTNLTSVNLAELNLVFLHSFFEVGSIALGIITLFIVRYGTILQISPRVTAIALVVFGATALDLVHMLFYASILDSSQGEHVWVTSWVFYRLLWSFGLLFSVTLSEKESNTTGSILSNRTLFFFTLIGIGGLILNILLNYTLLPNLTINHYNQPVVLYSQIAACLADSLALYILLPKCSLNTSKHLPVALCFTFVADACFSFQPPNPFSINIAGHIFKLAADFFLLQYLYRLVIRQPYEELSRQNIEATQSAQNYAQLYQNSEQQRDLFEDTLAKIGTIISSQLNVNETLAAIADMIADTMNAHQSIIALFTKDRSVLRVAQSYGINAPPDQIPLKNSVAGQACDDKSVHIIDDVNLHPGLFRPILIFSSIRSIICAPLINDHQVIGIIEAYSSEKSAFTNQDALLLKALSHHASGAITSAKLFEQTKIRLAEEKILYQIAQFSAATTDTNKILEKSTLLAVKALRADVGAGFSVNETSDLFTHITSVELTSKLADFHQDTYPDFAKALKKLSPSVASIEILPPLKEIYPEQACLPIMIIPLPVDHRLIGCIILAWHRFSNAEQLERHSFAALMGQQIALGLEKAHLDNQVKAMALSDSLTGLANRRNFNMVLTTELRRAVALKRPLSLLMIDLDKFKTFNDTYGHLTGDELLSQLGQILQQAVRGIDLPARYGGEEFSIILPECTKTEAAHIAEKIRCTVESTFFPDNTGALTARITASLGVATYDPALKPKGPDITQFISAADSSLYEAKHQGRNRVVIAESC